MNTDAARPNSGSSPSFPATCKRCGGQVSEPVTFCPHCGAYARLAFGPQTRAEAAQMPDGRTEPRADNLWRTPPAPLNTSADFDPYNDMRASSFGTRSFGSRARIALFIGGFAVLLGGAVFAHHWFATGPGSLGDVARNAFDAPQAAATAGGGASAADSGNGVAKPAEPPAVGAAAPAVPSVQPAPSTQSTQTAPQGAPPGAPPATQATPATAGVQPGIAGAVAGAPNAGVPNTHNAPLAAAGVAPSAAAQPVPQTAVAPVAGASGAGIAAPAAQSSQQAVAAVQAPDDQAALGRGTEREQRRAAIRAEVRAADGASARDAGAGIASARLLAGARDSLAKNDLSAAHALLSRTGQMNGEAAQLREDLRAREASRDAALGSARDCAAQQRWQCAWHNAGNALAIDSSSREARALVRRAIIESGAATSPPGPGSGPDVPMLQP